MAEAEPRHGGYPTPRYEEAGARRRAESERIYGHTGAHVPHAVEQALEKAGQTHRYKIKESHDG